VRRAVLAATLAALAGCGGSDDKPNPEVTPAATEQTATGCQVVDTSGLTSRDVVGLVRAGEPLAIQIVRDAGRYLGEVLASSVNFFNPGAIVIGGDISDAHQQLLAGVREVIFQRSLPLATGDLRIVPSRLGDRAGVIGAAIMVIEHILDPEAIDKAIEAGVAAA
jgi:predicted NBD/HSP70 family sugar kinase